MNGSSRAALDRRSIGAGHEENVDRRSTIHEQRGFAVKTEDGQESVECATLGEEGELGG